MPLYELRLARPSGPGAFAALGQALATTNANLLGLDNVDIQPDRAIDQVLVELSADKAEPLRQALADLPDVEVETFHPVPRRPTFEGPLELVQTLVAARPDDVLQRLAEGMPDALRATWAIVLADRHPQPQALAASVGAPSLVNATLPWMPIDSCRSLPVDDWIPPRWDLDPARAHIAAAPLDDTSRSALLVARKHGPAFRRQELRRLTAMALLGGRLDDQHAARSKDLS
jgi:hypothetical protein